MTVIRLQRSHGPEPDAAIDDGSARCRIRLGEADDLISGNRSGGWCILNFHGIGEPRRELEAGEAPYWLDLDRFRRVIDALAEHPRRESVRITFDDGNVSDLAIAAPLLKERGLTARFFVLTSRISCRGSLDRAGIGELQDLGMRIGSHGTAHRDWTALSTRELDEELVSSKRILEDICRHPITEAAIPFGRYRRRVIDALRRAGYAKVYSSDGGPAQAASYLRPRLSVRSDTPSADIASALDGRIAGVGRLRRAVRMTCKRIV